MKKQDNKKYNKKYIVGLTGGLLALILTAGTALADTEANANADVKIRLGVPTNFINKAIRVEARMEGKNRPQFVGKVSAVSGSTLTVSQGNDRDDDNDENNARVFTVNAGSAVIIKGNATTTVSSIAVGDNVIVRGTLNGSVVTATEIRDNAPRSEKEKDQQEKKDKKDKEEKERKNTMPLAIQGNGQPVVGGKVTAVSTTTMSMSLSTKTNVIYTVNLTNAKFQNGNATTTVSSIAIGDEVIVQGAVNGTAINASLVIEQGSHATATPKMNKPGKGMLKAFSNFFVRIFGF